MLEDNYSDDIYLEIRKYITKNPDLTINRVVKYIFNDKKMCAKQTAQNRVNDLIESGKIIDKRSRGKRGFHHLYIDENNKFDLILKELLQIESIMDAMDEPIQKILQFQERDEPKDDASLLKAMVDRNEKPTNYIDLHDNFLFPYQESFSMMLRILFVQINDAKLSEVDSLTLHTKIVKLTLRLTTQIFTVNKQKEYLDFIRLKELKTFRLSTTKAFAKRNNINIELREKITSKIKDFEKKFLT